MSTPKNLPLRAKLTYGVHLLKALTRNHHKEMIPLLEPLLDKEAVIIDVGAHAGQFSKLFSKLRIMGKVYAFEPATYARSILETVVWAHMLNNVRILPWGLSDKPAKRTLHIPLKASGSLGFGLSHLGDDKEIDNRPTYEEDIELILLDEFVNEQNIDRVDLIKSDIEGWEMRMLAGAENTIDKFRPVIILEVNADFLGRAGDTPETMWEFLKKYDYEIQELLFEDGKVSTRPAPEPCHGDILCVSSATKANA